ncbi:LLM class flavin-dependent oxidoreductase [Saccharopolyspora sp. NPDC049426]|uniref:LLM class flavin-dependent oxidoreductase n=1 Tax=Saccharopolyspora sp. NPDC049426 TaxID=3155652 RepID=UPI003427E3CA
MTQSEIEGGVRLSVLDTAPIVEGSSARQALHNTVDLARLADTLGYHRYWVPEHHSMRGVASAAPAVLVGRLAEATRSIRVGSGGVLLPNHSPLIVAEQFGTLEALYPGRIDLGLGRALGGPPRVASVMGRTGQGHRDFAEQLRELLAYFDEPEPEPGTVTAVPAVGNRPQPWILGTGTASAELAGAFGFPYAAAHHLNADCIEVLKRYRETFQPSASTPTPRAIVSVSVIVADSDSRAEWLAGSTRLKILSRLKGSRIRLPSPEHAAQVHYTAEERATIDLHTRGLIAGGPQAVCQMLDVLIKQFSPDEILVTTPVFDPVDRCRSYELLAESLPLLGTV